MTQVRNSDFDTKLEMRNKLEKAYGVKKVCEENLADANMIWAKALHQAHELGLMNTEIARVVGCTEASVRMFRKRHAADEMV